MAAVLLGAAAAGAQTVTLSEIRIDQPGTDNDEYFELAGAPGTSLAGLTYLVIGDGAGASGTIEAVVDLTGSSIPASGFFVAAEGTFTLGTADLVTSVNFENSDNATHLLVDGFTGANGDDLDADDDGVLDVTPWSTELDRIALVEEENPPTGTEFHYGPPSVGPDGTFVPGHSYSCPAGWEIGVFDPVGGVDTPGAANPCVVVATALLSEIRIDQPSADDDEYFELSGASGTSLDGLTYLVLGDGAGGSGVIEAVVDLTGSSIPASGFFVAAEATFTLGVADLVTSLNFENGDNVTHLLVRDFTGANGDDLDADDDGLLDVTPWSEALDCVALLQSTTAGELTYCDVSNGPDGTFVPGHSFLCDDGWQIGAFDPTGGDDTPGAENDCAPAAGSLVVNEIDYDQPGSDTAEFVELKNTGTTPVDLDAYELQLINGSGATAYQTIDLPAVTIPAGGYYVLCTDLAAVLNCDEATISSVQNGAPDAVALVLAGAVVDTVSYEGDTAAPYTEGSGAGLADPGTTGSDFLGISRFPDGADTDVNNVDLSTRCTTPGAANSADTGSCDQPSTPSVVINEIDYDQPSSDTAEFIELKNTGTSSVDLCAFTVELVNGNGGSIYQTVALPSFSLAAGDYYVLCADATTVVNCDLAALSSIQNGAPDAVGLRNSGTLVDAVSYEGDTVAPYTEGSGAGLTDPGTSGSDFLGISRFPDGADSDQNNVDLSTRCITPGSENIAASTDCVQPVLSALVVNEVDYDQPGGDSAEFVEIKNVSGSAVDLSAYTLELINGSGATAYQSIALPAVSLGAGGFFVVCADAATVANCDLDTISSIQNGAPDVVALTLAGEVIDTVSYEGDTAAPYTEGSGAGLEDSGATGEDNKGISRVPDGVDTDQNNVDFASVCITPGGPNTSFGTNCSGTGVAFEIFEIQGAGLLSSFDGQVVSTNDNIVTAVGDTGFFIQTPTARTDGDPVTSDGIFVFLGAPATVAVGDQVDVTGLVDEFFDFTEITGVPLVTVDSSGNPLPAAVVLDATTPSGTQPQPDTELERFEGMLVTFSGTATGPSDRFGDVAVVARTERSYREPGIEFPGLAGLPVWDGNPEIFEVNPDGLMGPDSDVFAGQPISASGPLAFSFGDYQVWPTSLTLGAAPVLPELVRDRAPGEFTVASQNMLRLFDDQDDPATGEPVLTPAEFQDALAKFSLHFRGTMDAPDIIAFQEVENLNVLQSLAARIQADDPSLVYTANLIEGNDVGGIDVGFLTRDTVQVNSVAQFGEALTLSVDGSLLHDRPPLVLDATYTAGGASFDITVIVVHNRSLSGIDDTGSNGTRVKTKRLEQAETLAQFIQDIQIASPDTHIVVTGDFNAFQFTDGYVDVVGILSGDLDPAGAEFPGSDLIDPNLTNQVLSLPAEDQYSFIFGGSAQVLDHALTSANLAPFVSGFQFVRGAADAPDSFVDDPASPLRVSDHDGLVLFITAGDPDADGDGVADGDDLCPNTTIPESVPTRHLGILRYALVDGDTTFDTRAPWWLRRVPTFTTEDTAGCSCEQIIDELGLGHFQRSYGCGLWVMKFWVHRVSD